MFKMKESTVALARKLVRHSPSRSTNHNWIPNFRSVISSRHVKLQTRWFSAYGYTQSKSLVYQDYGNPADVLSLHSYSISPPHGNLVTVKTLAAPMNPADINQIQGVYPAKPRFTSSLGTVKRSAVPGNEAVFEVVATGSSIAPDGPDGLRKGDWVIAGFTGLGTWRTHLQVEANHLLKVNKEGLSPLQAATVAVNPVTAWRMLTDFVSIDASKGDWFVVNGANSGVGRAALQLGKLWGWNSIAVVRGGRPAEQLDRLKEDLRALGATRVTTDEEVLGRDFGSQVSEWTAGGRELVKLGLNCVGGKSSTAMAKILSPGAHLVTYGAMSKQPISLPAGLLIFKNLIFQGFWVSKWGDSHPDEKRQTVNNVLDMYREGLFVDVPYEEVNWEWATEREKLVSAVQSTLDGYRKGKGIFVFGNT